MMQDLIYNNAPEYFQKYFDLARCYDLMSGLDYSEVLTNNLFQSLRQEELDKTYSSGKWTLKQVLRHIIDCERIFSYRALRFSRFDITELAGFDDNEYSKNVLLINNSISVLQAEYNAVRLSTKLLFNSMTPAMLDFFGKANGFKFSARAIGFMIIGHNIHHCNIITERYLNI